MRIYLFCLLISVFPTAAQAVIVQQVYNVDRFLKIHPGGQDNLFLALSRDKVLGAAGLPGPLAAEENLRAALGYEMDRLTPFSADAVYYDYYILKRFPVKNQVYLMLVAVKKEVLDYYLTLLKRIGVRPRGIEITSTALFNVYTSEKNGADKLFQIDWLPQNKIPASLRNKVPWLFTGKLSARPDEGEQADSPIDVLVMYLNARCEINLVSDGMLFYSRSLPLARGADDATLRRLSESYGGPTAMLHCTASTATAPHPVRRTT